MKQILEQAVKSHLGNNVDSQFVSDTLYDFTASSMAKYKLGAEEHGGGLVRDHLHLIDEIKNEVIDQNFYVYAIEKKIKISIDFITDIQNSTDDIDIVNKLESIKNYLKNL